MVNELWEIMTTAEFTVCPKIEGKLQKLSYLLWDECNFSENNTVYAGQTEPSNVILCIFVLNYLFMPQLHDIYVIYLSNYLYISKFMFLKSYFLFHYLFMPNFYVFLCNYKNACH